VVIVGVVGPVRWNQGTSVSYRRAFVAATPNFPDIGRAAGLLRHITAGGAHRHVGRLTRQP